jgi:hypothetical protein
MKRTAGKFAVKVTATETFWIAGVTTKAFDGAERLADTGMFGKFWPAALIAIPGGVNVTVLVGYTQKKPQVALA